MGQSENAARLIRNEAGQLIAPPFSEERVKTVGFLAPNAGVLRPRVVPYASRAPAETATFDVRGIGWQQAAADVVVPTLGRQ